MVPNGWEHKAFGEVVKLSKSKYDPKKSTDCFPCIELEHIAQETGQLTGNVPASNLGSTKNKFKAGDVIFGKLRPYLRKYAQPNFDGVCSSEIWVFSPTKKIINPYLFQLVQTNQFISEANKSAGSKMPRADWGVVSEMVFPLPPLPEQRKIAKILSTWDKAISTTERLIDNSKQQKKALIQQLLTGKKRLLDDSGKPFEGEWEEVKLGDLSSKVTKGTTPSTNGFSFQQDGINFVKVESISSSGRFDRSKFAYIDNDCYESFKRSQLEKDDILFSIAGALGRTALVDETILPANTNQALAIIRLNRSRTVHRYIIYFLNSPRIASVIKGLTAKAAQPNLSLKDVNGLTILLPSLEEQEKISTALFNADKEMELLEQQLADLKQEKKALMQQLLTGKRRVKVDEEAVA